MKKKIVLLIGVMLLAACSIKVSGNSDNNQGYILVTNTPPAPTPTSAANVAITLEPISIPADLKLSGHLVYGRGVSTLVRLDLATGQLTKLFSAGGNAWITGASVSPDDKQIVMAFSPSTTDTAQVGYATLYVLPVDGSAEPKLFLKRLADQESYSTPVWSMDGKYIYYAHEVQDTTSHQKYVTYKYILERATYPDGQTQPIVDQAFWPRLSPDGSKLAYVSFNPQANANDLYISNLDGSNPKLALPAGDFFAVDAPLFSPDSKSLMFSAVGQPTVSQLSWFDQLMDVQVAEAHSVPSEWWRVPVAGGKPEQLTNIADTGMYGDFSLDGRYVVFVSANGLSIMEADGTGLRQLSNNATGTVDWSP